MHMYIIYVHILCIYIYIYIHYIYVYIYIHVYITFKGWNSQAHRELPRNSESRILSLRILSLQIDHTPDPSTESFSQPRLLRCVWSSRCPIRCLILSDPPTRRLLLSDPSIRCLILRYGVWILTWLDATLCHERYPKRCWFIMCSGGAPLSWN